MTVKNKILVDTWLFYLQMIITFYSVNKNHEYNLSSTNSSVFKPIHCHNLSEKNVNWCWSIFQLNSVSLQQTFLQSKSESFLVTNPSTNIKKCILLQKSL